MREIFIDRMWNYFGIEDKSELAYFGTIYDQAVAPIIRTEKLKLLAEVRERVIGEDDKQTRNDAGFGDWFTCATCNVILSDETASNYLCICTLRNDLRVEQRAALGKLEADL